MSSVKPPEIYRSGAHYDAINCFDFDVPFYKKLSERIGLEVLELGCGTGRISIPLAKSGAKVTGVDCEENMLDWAKQKASKASCDITFINSSMTQLELNTNFDLVLCVHNTFNHIAELEEVKAFFKTIHAHLKNDGRFILQLFNPDVEILNRDPSAEYPLISYTSPDTERQVELLETSYYDAETQMLYNKWIYEEAGQKRRTENFAIRVYFPAEMDNLVELMGFEIEDKFGDFDETPFHEYPDTQIFVLKKCK